MEYNFHFVFKNGKTVNHILHYDNEKDLEKDVKVFRDSMGNSTNLSFATIENSKVLINFTEVQYVEVNKWRA